jgi:hypothetical protein
MVLYGENSFAKKESSMPQQLADSNSAIAVYPLLAPLSSTFIRYSFHYRYQTEYIPLTEPVFSPEEAAALARKQYDRIWTNYLDDFRNTRKRLAEDMDGEVLLDKHRSMKKKYLNPTTFRHLLSQYGPSDPVRDQKLRSISADTIEDYIKGGVLKKEDWGIYDPESMIKLLICRQLDRTRVRNWIPAKIADGEEDYWIWTQERPNAPLRPCPYPNLPTWLSPTSLVFTRWIGASWRNVGWIRIGNLGAISFAGLLQANKPSMSTFEELPLVFTTQQLELWNRRPKAVESIAKQHETHERVDVSGGLADTLKILAYKHSTGTLQAMVKRGPREMVCSIELLHGTVASSTHELSELLKIDGRQPAAWTFQAHPTDERYVSSFDPAAACENQLETRSLIIKTLRRLAVPIFSASNLRNI